MQRTVIDKIEYLILLVSSGLSLLEPVWCVGSLRKALQHHAHTLGGGQYADSPILLPSERRDAMMRLYHGSIVSIDSTHSVHSVPLTNS